MCVCKDLCDLHMFMKSHINNHHHNKQHIYIYIYICIHIYSINMISIISTTSGINMAVIIHCVCDLHGFVHVCMRFAFVYEKLYE